MAHNITDKDGLVLFQNPAWHGLGNVLTKDITPDMAIMEAGLDWGVEMYPGVSVVDQLGRSCSSDRHQALVRMDTGDILGVHGSRYQPVQNRDLFEIAYALGGQVMVEAAGSLDEGRKLFVLLRGDTLGLKNNDTSVPYLALTNSHDGSAKMSAVPTTVRVVCENTLSLMFQEAGSRMYTVTHNGSIDAKINSMKQALVRFQNDTTSWLDIVTTLQDKTMNHSETVAFWGQIYSRIWGQPVTEEEKDKAAATLGKWELTMETEIASMAYGQADLWIAANAVSQDIQHSDPIRKRDGWQTKRLENNWFGETAKSTATVFQQAVAALS